MPVDPYGQGGSKKKVAPPRHAVSPQPTAAQREQAARTAALQRMQSSASPDLATQQKLKRLGFVGASEVDNRDAALAAAHPQPTASPAPATQPPKANILDAGHYGRVALARGFRVNDRLSPRFRGEKPIGSFQTPTGIQYVYRDQNLDTGFDPQTGWTPQQQAEAAHQRRQNLGSTSATARDVLGGLTGYTSLEKAIHSGDAGTTAKELAAQAAWFFPWIRGPRAVGESIRAFEAGAGARASLQAGRASMRGPGPIKEAYTRTFKHEGATATIPAARSRTGRAIENLADAIRPVVSKTGLQKSESERFGQEFGRSQGYRQKTQQAAAVALTRVGRKLDDSAQYALRVVKEGVTPQERMAEHVALASQSPHDEEVLYHTIHASMSQDAAKWIKIDAEGRPVLKSPDDFTTRGDKKQAARLQEASDILSKVASTREDIYRELGRLTDQQIADRIQAPGRIYKGARWQETNRIIEDNLANNPTRQQLISMVHAYVGEGPKANGIIHLIDAQARRFAQETGNPETVSAFFDELGGFANITEPPTGDFLAQGTGSNFSAGPGLDVNRAPNAADQLLRNSMGRHGNANADIGDEVFSRSTNPEILRAFEQGQAQGGVENGIFAAARTAESLRDFKTAENLIANIRDRQRRDMVAMHFFGDDALAQVSQITSPGQKFPFFSKLAEVIFQSPEKVGVAELKGKLKSAGVKEEEVEWSNFNKFLASAEEAGVKSISKDEALAWLDEHYLQIEENLMGPLGTEGTKFRSYSLAGGEDYHELVIRLPQDKYGHRFAHRSHFDDTNPLAHMRFTSRDVDGKTSLFIEEIQSDWHQQAQTSGYAQRPENHPEWERRNHAVHQAQEDVNSIRGNILRTWEVFPPELGITDAITFQDFFGVNLHDSFSVNEFLAELRQLEPYVGHGPSFTVKNPPQESEYGRIYAEHPTQGEQVFTHSWDHDVANKRAKKWNALLDLPVAEFRSLESKLEALDRAIYAHRQAGHELRDIVASSGRGIADAPFKKTWHELAFKRMLTWAAEHGYERVAWTTGEQQAQRYGLGHFLDRLEVNSSASQYEIGGDYYNEQFDKAWERHQDYNPEDIPSMPMEEDYQTNIHPGQLDLHGNTGSTLDQGAYDEAMAQYQDAYDEAARSFQEGFDDDWYYTHGDRSDQYTIQGWRKPEDGSALDLSNPDIHQTIGDHELDDQIGHDLAEKVREGQTTFEGNALVVGPHAKSALGASQFYDRKLVGFANKYLKKFKVEVKSAKIENGQTVHSIDITPEAKQFIHSGQALFQTGVLGPGHVGPHALKGAISFDDGQAMVYLTEHSDLSTFAHEIAHYVRRYKLSERELKVAGRHSGAQPIKEKINGRTRVTGYNWSVSAEENFARQFESYLRDGRSPNPQLTNTFRSISTELRSIYEHEDLPDVHPSLAKMFDRLLSPKEVKGGRLVGHEDFNLAVDYIPYVRGVPYTNDEIRASVGAYIRSTNRLFGAGRKQAIGAGPDDIALRKTFKGALILSGFFKIDTTTASAKSLVTASRLSAAHEARKGLLDAATDVPTDISDVAIKVDPKKNTSPALKALWDRMDRADTGGVLISQKELDALDFDLVEAARRDVFPADVDGRDVRTIAGDAIDNQKPVDNIKWVSRDVLENSGLLYVPHSARMAQSGLNKTIKRGVQAGLITVDAINDFQKALILYLNPAYIPVNLTGNLVMNAMQQGVFMPVNLWRSAAMHQWLDVTERTLIDSHMGHGLTGSLSLRTTPGQLMHATLGHYINLAVDLIPRRSAWIHEARVEGFDTKEKMKDLLQRALNGDEAAHVSMEAISRRANDAIVDYERMNPFEREVMTRIIFFYPWLKGATRYSSRFIAEHPLQAAGLAMAADNAYTVSNDILGDRPEYAQLDVPFNTRALGLRIPGVGSVTAADVVGEHQWSDRGYPMKFNPRQALTFTTPLDIYRAGIGFISGDQNAPAAVQNLVPALYASGVALYGYDPFTNKQVPKGMGTFMHQLVGGIPVVDRYRKINMSEKERKRYQKVAINPRTKTQEIERLFGSSLAPAPYNPDIGAQRVHSSDPVWKLMHDSEKAGLGKPPPEVMKELDTHIELTRAIKKGMTPLDKAQAALPIYVKATGDHSFDQDVKNEKSQAAGQAYYSAMREILFPNLNAWTNEMDKLIDSNLEDQSG